jgi:hypothetical protein
MSLRVSPTAMRTSTLPEPWPAKSWLGGLTMSSSALPPRTMPAIRPASTTSDSTTATGLRRRRGGRGSP